MVFLSVLRAGVEMMSAIADLGNLNPPKKHKRLFALLSSHLRFLGLCRWFPLEKIVLKSNDNFVKSAIEFWCRIGATVI